MDGVIKTAIHLSLIAIAILLYKYGYLWPIIKFIILLILFLTSICVIFHYARQYIKRCIKDIFELTREEKKELREKRKKKNAKS